MKHLPPIAAARALAAATVLSCMTGPPAHAGEPDRLTRIQSSKVLRVCIWPDYYGISYRSPKTLQLSGIDIDNARALAAELGVEARFVDSSFARLVQDLEADHCDLAMFAIGITPSRQERLRFTQPHLVSDICAVTTRANRRVQSWADIDKPGMVVAVAKGTLHEQVMKDRLVNAELRVLDTPHAREQEVQSGRADVFMTDYPFSRRMLDNNDWARLVTPPAAYHLTPYAWAMLPGDDRFTARLNGFVASIKADGRLMGNARRYGLDPIVAP